MICPSVQTKLFILLGNPLGHSISPPMHNHVFDTLNLDYCYLPVEVSEQNLGFVFDGLKRMNVGGFNVTIPHKINIMRYLDQLDPIAHAIGAVNTIHLENGKTIGYNTDGEGFICSLTEQTGMDVQEKKFYLLGCGGAARAIAITLAYKGAASIYLSNRTLEKAVDLAEEINSKVSPCAQAVSSPDQATLALAESDVIINCTNIGMHPNDKKLPINPGLIKPHQIVADIVYNPLHTRLLKEAQARGCQIVPGLGMLVHQGAAAFRIWTGREPLTREMSELAQKLLIREDT